MKAATKTAMGGQLRRRRTWPARCDATYEKSIGKVAKPKKQEKSAPGHW